MSQRNIIIAIVAVLLVLLLAWAWKTCRLGKYSAKSCPAATKGSFCGSTPAPGAMSEAAGLFELGCRMASEGFCGSTPAPAAIAEAQGLMQMGWRPERMRPRPTCAGPHPTAIAEAQSLQHAGALRPGSPYYQEWRSPEGFRRSPERFQGCAGVSPEAVGELEMLQALQAAPTGQAEQMRSNPAQVSARRARFASVSEGFGGPAQAGFGWNPTPADVAASPATGGWGDDQSVAAARCMDSCMDGCGGTNCRDHCQDRCRTEGILAATGQW